MANFDWACAQEGTRLAVPADQASTQAMVDWLQTQPPWADGDTDVSLITIRTSGENITKVFQTVFYLGAKQRHYNATSLSNSWHPQNLFHFVGSELAPAVTEPTCRVLGSGIADGKMIPEDCGLAGTGIKVKGLCQRTSCTSVSGLPCVFPFKYLELDFSLGTCFDLTFRYQGRLYDTCVKLGVAEDSPAWCSTFTDSGGNHVRGTEAECPSSCPWTNCPVGFYRAHNDRACYKVIFIVHELGIHDTEIVSFSFHLPMRRTRSPTSARRRLSASSTAPASGSPGIRTRGTTWRTSRPLRSTAPTFSSWTLPRSRPSASI